MVIGMAVGLHFEFSWILAGSDQPLGSSAPSTGCRQN
jgi:hypothetical protein